MPNHNCANSKLFLDVTELCTQVRPETTTPVFSLQQQCYVQNEIEYGCTEMPSWTRSIVSEISGSLTVYTKYICQRGMVTLIYCDSMITTE